jgi:hypothetical protein
VKFVGRFDCCCAPLPTPIDDERSSCCPRLRRVFGRLIAIMGMGSVIGKWSDGKRDGVSLAERQGRAWIGRSQVAFHARFLSDSRGLTPADAVDSDALPDVIRTAIHMEGDPQPIPVPDCVRRAPPFPAPTRSAVKEAVDGSTSLLPSLIDVITGYAVPPPVLWDWANVPPACIRVDERFAIFYQTTADCNLLTAQQPLRESALRWTVRVVRPVPCDLVVGVSRVAGHKQMGPEIFDDALLVSLSALPVETPASCAQLLDAYSARSVASYSISLEADLAHGRLYLWLNGQFCGAVFDGIPELSAMRPVVTVNNNNRPEGYGPADMQTVELIDSPLHVCDGAALILSDDATVGQMRCRRCWLSVAY